jgi:hypothetical protein
MSEMKSAEEWVKLRPLCLGWHTQGRPVEEWLERIQSNAHTVGFDEGREAAARVLEKDAGERAPSITPFNLEDMIARIRALTPKILEAAPPQSPGSSSPAS